MKQSNRALRRQRHYRRRHQTGSLNLVSLMDIFTILVFFLMVNSGDVQVLQTNVKVKLPESVADQEPKETLAVVVSGETVLVGGRQVATLGELRASADDLVPGLQEELEYQARRAAPVQGDRAITILADRELPYQLLKKIMSTCVSAGYPLISLAVTKKVDTGV